MKRGYANPGQGGFSLIELLVVLVILGLLAGLVLPNVMGRLGSAKHKAARSKITLIQQSIDLFVGNVRSLHRSFLPRGCGWPTLCMT